MKRVVALAAAIMVCFGAPAMAQSFRAGAATSNVTPPLGNPIVGGFVPFPATHVHDELHVRCLVLDDGKTKLAFVVCDLLGIDRNVSDEARALIEQDLKIPKANVLISATHTHSACSALGKDARVISDTMDEYQRFVARRIVDGVKRANNLLRPAQIGFGTASAPEHVFNRRWHMKPGAVPLNPFGKEDKVKMNPPAGSADLLEPAGPTDPEIPFVVLRESAKEHRPIAVFSTYSLHYVGGVGSGHISADYFGMYCDAIERLLKAERQTPAFVALMANGTSGDINNINFRKPRPKQEPYAQMKYVADDVASKVHAALEKVAYREDVTLDARYAEPAIAIRRPDADLTAWAKKTLADRKPDAKKADMPAIYAERTLRMAEHPEKLKMPLQVLRVGDRVIATMPCEVFCEIGLAYKKATPNGWMVSLNHGYYGYLPTPRQHELGGYETWLGTNRLEVNASEKMLATLREMTAELIKKR
jgi:hypothetical protein